MNDYIVRLEDFVKIVWMILLSIFAPIKVAIIVLMFFFAFNFFVGFKNDKIVHDKDFNLKKAFEGVKLLSLYYAIIFIVNVALSLFNEQYLAENAIKFISWIVCYWYLVNILKNSKEIFPWSKGLKFLYDLLTVEVLDMIMERFGMNRKRHHRRRNEQEENEPDS